MALPVFEQKVVAFSGDQLGSKHPCCWLDRVMAALRAAAVSRKKYFVFESRLDAKMVVCF